MGPAAQEALDAEATRTASRKATTLEAAYQAEGAAVAGPPKPMISAVAPKF
jgi:hypothetical protein